MTTDYRFSPAEIAVVLQHVWGPALPAGDNLSTDLGVETEALAAARQALRQRQMLLPAPDRARGETFVSPPLWAVVATATRPVALGALEITLTDQPARSLYFTWAPQRMVANWVDERGQHTLQPLDDVGAFADLALRAGGLDTFAPDPAAAPPDDPEAVASAATLRAVYVTAINLPEPREEAQALSWLVSLGQLWLMQPAAGGGQANLGPATPTELRAAIVASTERAIVNAQADLEAEV